MRHLILAAVAPIALIAAPAALAQGGAPDPIKAMLADPEYLALKAKSDAGDPAAMVALSDFIWDRLTGPGRIGMQDKAMRARLGLLDGAMKLGYGPAMRKLGEIALIGDGMAKDRRIALEFYRMGAEAGDLESIRLAASLHLSEEQGPLYVPVDVKKGPLETRSFEEIMASLKEPPPPNPPIIYNGDEAVRLLTMPAARGDVEARRMLAGAYLNEKKFRQGAQPQKAIAILELLIKREDPRDYRMLADLYYSGFAGVPADPVKAALYYGQAAAKGDGRSAHMIGFMHVLGKGVEQNDGLAFAYFQKSAAAGYAKGMTSLGVCYLEGRGTAKNEALAAEWFQKAGEAGDAEGAFDAAELWNAGVNGVRNPMRAWINYKKAAELGSEKAKAKLATFKPN